MDVLPLYPRVCIKYALREQNSVADVVVIDLWLVFTGKAESVDMMNLLSVSTRRFLPLLPSAGARFITSQGAAGQDQGVGPLAEYKRFCDHGTLELDRDQLLAVTQLQSLYDRCLEFGSLPRELTYFPRNTCTPTQDDV